MNNGGNSGNIFNDRKKQIKYRFLILLIGMYFVFSSVVGGFIALFIKSLTSSSENTISREVVLKLFGEFAWILFVIVSVAFLIVGIVLIVFSRKLTVLHKKYQKYFSLIATRNVTSILEISGIIKKPESIVADDLQDMIRINYINAQIDFKSKKIVLLSPPIATTYPQQFAPNPIPQQPMPFNRSQPPYLPQNPMQQVDLHTKIDLNSASEQQLASLPGVSMALAKKALGLRTQSGGFLSTKDFCQRLELMPHFAVQIENLAFVTPIDEKPQSLDSKGRVIDI